MKTFSTGFPMLDLEKILQATVHRSGNMGRLEKTCPDLRSARKKFPDEKFSLGDMRWDLEKNRQGDALGLRKKSTRGRVGT